MRVGTFASASLASLALAVVFCVGCGGSTPKGAEAPDKDPWADYKGTFAGPSTSAPSTSTATASKKETAKAKDVEPEPVAAVEPPKPPAKTAPSAKKPGKRTAR